MNLSTTLSLKNGERYPMIAVNWEKDKDGLGYKGTLVKWLNGTDSDGLSHTVSIRQTYPLGSIHIMFDQVNGGCWKMCDWPGVTVTERDLQWATAWGALAKELKERALPPAILNNQEDEPFVPPQPP